MLFRSDEAAWNRSAPLGSVDVTTYNGDSATVSNMVKMFGQGAIPFTVGATDLSDVTCLTNLTEATDDHYKGKTLYFLDNNLAGQTTYVQAYDGTTKVITFAKVTEAPASGDLCLLV